MGSRLSSLTGGVGRLRRSTRVLIVLALVVGASVSTLLPSLTSSPPVARGAVADSGNWYGTWAAGLVAPPDTSTISVGEQTVRMTVHVSVGGATIRIRLANTFGGSPVTFGTVYVGRRAAAGTVKAGTNRRVTFHHGAKAVSVPAGERVASDPVSLDVPAGGDLVVSAYLPAGGSGPTSWHPNAMATTYLSGLGDHAAEESAAAYSQTSFSWFFLDGVDVQGGAKGAIVAFGDSLTDGVGSTPGTNRRYPDVLAARLRNAGVDRSVVNAGIGGNRMLAEGVHYGTSALARFERDALRQTGVSHVLVLEGINDIGLNPLIRPADLIGSYRELIERAHAAGVRIYGGTLLPYRGAGYYTDLGERTREAVNKWIRTSGEYDGVVDFDAAVRDPAAPSRLRPAYDSGDHLHPSDAGYRAMADAVDLRLFELQAAAAKVHA